LAAAALIFGSLFCSCSDSDDNSEETSTTPPPADEVVTPTSVTFDLSKTGSYKDTLLAIFNGGDVAIAVNPSADTTLIASDEVTQLVIGNDEKNISLKYNQDSGFTIKGGKNASAMTIKNVKGNVKVTVTWAIAGKKDANDRKLTLKAGDQIDEKGNADTSSADSAVAIDNTNEITYDFRSGGTDIMIDASNEIIVKTIVIAAVQN
ncbi:MAG: hypothetical protein NC041_02465, partial [Bacteroides sp.]|nr:hypothetical protein [Prevotella sp.]MCM1469317.1 hypothetical protein [Bacteroides sp.]